MRKNTIWILGFLIVQIIVFLIIGFTSIASNTKCLICAGLIAIELSLILHSDTTVNRKRPHSLFPDSPYIREIIAQFNLGNLLTTEDILKEYDLYKSFEKKKYSKIAKAYIPDKYFTSKSEYKSYIKRTDWETFILQVAIWRIVDNESLFDKNRIVFSEIVNKVYGYSFYHECGLILLNSIKHISENAYFAHDFFDYLQKLFYKYIKYCVFMKNNATLNGFIKWTNILKNNRMIDSKFRNAVIPAIEQTHKTAETDTIYFPEVQESEVICYINDDTYIFQHFADIDKMVE